MRISLIFLSLACTFQVHSAVTQLNALSFARADGSDQTVNMQRAVNAAVSSGYRLYVPPGIIYTWNLLTNTENLFIDDDTIPGQATYYGGMQIIGPPGVTNSFPNLYIHSGKFSVERMFISITDTGGDPTATADSRNALQAAINAARIVGADVVVPAGNFRVNLGMPIQVGNVTIRGPGKLWVSLPDDYVNNNDYSTSQVYIATNVLDQNGNLVNYTNSFAFQGPWNGKGSLFTAAVNATIADLQVDGGWGSTGVPGTVRPITGIRTDGDEFTYYTMFHNNQNVRFERCKLSNAPGDYITVGWDVSVLGCEFGEYGDHVFYFGQSSDSQNNYQFIGNRIVTGRAQVGVLGDTNYVAVSSRDILKFRGNKNVTVTGNISTNTLGNRTRFVTLETWSQQPGHCANVVIANNIFTGERFMSASSTRDSTVVSTNFEGWKVKDVLVTGNTANASEYGFLFNDASMENVTISDNTIFTSAGLLAQIHGNMYFTNGITGLRFIGNRLTQNGNQTVGILLSGRIKDVKFSDGNIFNSGSTNFASNRNLISATCFSALNGIPVFNQPSDIGQIIFTGNEVYNYFSVLFDSGWAAYDNAATYTYGTVTTDDGTFENYAVVTSGGVRYRNTATTTGVAPPNSPWVAYTPTDCDFLLADNYKEGNSAAASPSSVEYWTQVFGLTRHNYRARTRLNIHYTKGTDIPGTNYLGMASVTYTPMLFGNTDIVGNFNLSSNLTVYGSVIAKGQNNTIGASLIDSRFGVLLAAAPTGDGSDSSALRVYPFFPAPTINPTGAITVNSGAANASALYRAAAIWVKDAEKNGSGTISTNIGVLISDQTGGTNNTLLHLGSENPREGDWALVVDSVKKSYNGGELHQVGLLQAYGPVEMTAGANITGTLTVSASVVATNTVSTGAYFVDAIPGIDAVYTNMISGVITQRVTVTKGIITGLTTL